MSIELVAAFEGGMSGQGQALLTHPSGYSHLFSLDRCGNFLSPGFTLYVLLPGPHRGHCYCIISLRVFRS